MATPHNFRDLTGVRFEAHELEVIERAGTNDSNQVTWRCLTDDGRIVLRTASYLHSYTPNRKPREPRPPREPKPKPPRVAPAPEKTAWSSMIQRCSSNHADYGGRGITVCERWKDSYEAFLADVGLRPSRHHSLDRKDPDGNYEPGNVRWATPAEQARNTRATVYVEHDGVRLSLPDWADRLGVNVSQLANRLRQGLSPAEVLDPERRNTPPRTKPNPTKKNGLTLTREHRAWKAMVARCTDPGHQHYPQYGGRGITVCSEWLVFETFLAALGPCPPDRQLGRKNTSRGYELENAHWMTRTEAMRHSTAARLLEHDGEALPISAWSERTGLPVETIRSRLRTGWTVGQALGFESR